MRYVVALLMAGLILLALIAFRRHVAAEFQDTIRQAMREAKAAGDPALADVDPETHPSTDFGTDVSSNLKFKINVADFLATYWPFWIFLIVGGSLLAAWMIPVLK